MTESTPWPVERIAQAIGDPGSIVGRCFGPSWGVGNVGYMLEQETVPRWATRAVIAVLDEFDRDLQKRVDRAVQLESEMATKWFPVNSDRVQVPPRIYEDIARRWPDGTEPPADLVEEFPAELGEFVDADLAEQEAWANGLDGAEGGAR